MGSNAVAIFQTTDGGTDLEANLYQRSNINPAPATTLPFGGLKDGITPTDMNNAWIGGITYATGVIYLYQTQDGGQDLEAAAASNSGGIRTSSI